MSSNMLIDKNSPYCPGCGHMNVTLNLAKAIDSLEIDPLDVIVVSDIGCCGLIDPSLASHTIHGLHGRACALASGIALAIDNPNKKIIAIQGDGGATIGIAHLLEAARRNFNLTLIVNNNQIYGMTGGQLSGLSNENFQHENANIEEPLTPFNLIELAKSAGATYGCQLIGKGDFTDYLKKAINNNGFSIVEILEVCPSYGYQKYSEIENLGFKTYEFENKRNPFRLYKNEIKSLINFNESKVYFESNLDKPIKIILAGSAGEGIQSAAELFARAAISCNLNVTKKGDYPITVGTGFSVAELIISPNEIHYTGIEKADVLIAISQNGFDYTKTKIDDNTFVIADSSIQNLISSNKLTFDFQKTFGKKNSAISSLFTLLILKNIFPPEAFENSLHESKHREKFIQLIEKIKSFLSEINHPA
ncbi:MAG: thiamine pyrophosphate-dependent enzyme [Melioribacteraceae bacterium]|nr:thiamine pyrophosphate-dependent enzyme [Melioribacteraceae bacterium]